MKKMYRPAAALCAPALVTAFAAVLFAALVACVPKDTAEKQFEAFSSSDPAQQYFHRVATYPVFKNAPAGESAQTVAEISAVTEDGNTVIYTDAAGKGIGFIDITDPAEPRGLGTISLATIEHADDQPTSVAVVGDYALAVIDESGGDFKNPRGRLDVIAIATRELVRSFDLGGQPDSIAISPDKAYAAIAIENQRDEAFTPEGGEEGDLPQAPPGFVQVIDLATDPSDWVLTAVPLTEAGGALPSFSAAGIDTPEDPEPEYVDINTQNLAALTLQENNGIVIINLASKKIQQVFSAGNAVIENVDVTDDGIFNATETIDVPREMDSVQWVDEDLVAVANEGDWKGGSRGWSVFNAKSGALVWDAGNSFENLARRYGFFNDGRADNKGAEPEGLAFAVMDGAPLAFVGAERGNFVAVYDMTKPAKPRFVQLLPANNGPEGLLPIPSRGLLVISSEVDDAPSQIRAAVTIYRLGEAGVQPAFPSIISLFPAAGATVDSGAEAGAPIGWGALGALSGDPADASTLYAASDAAFATARIYTINVRRTPAVITDVREITNADGSVAEGLDIEGLAARAEGGFWLALEGTRGAENRIVRVDAAGVIQQSIELPADVSAHVRNWGLEGVAVQGSGQGEQLIVALQRPLWADPAAAKLQLLEGNSARLGRYSVASGTWEWFAYPLEAAAGAGDWVGLSEVVALGENTVAVIERDKLAGDAARIKRIYAVSLPAAGDGAGDGAGAAADTPPAPVVKTLAVDVLPLMQAQRGWTQEKLEGLGITADGHVFAVTDNDGLKNATGETQLYRLGAMKQIFAQ